MTIGPKCLYFVENSLKLYSDWGSAIDPAGELTALPMHKLWY